MTEEEIQFALAQFPGDRRAAGGVVLGNDADGLLYITEIDSEPQDPDLAPEEGLLTPFCSKSEILRLRAICSAQDYLLRFRVNAIADSPRLTRVMAARRQRYERGGRPWSLTAYYAALSAPAKRYLQRLPEGFRAAAKAVPFGFAALDEANAICLRSLVGDVIMVSEALRHFYYYMTLCLHGHRYGVDPLDCVDAGLIALRVMIGSESQDFEIDPRGVLPPQHEAAIRQHIDAMIGFTFGHEFAHLTLGHLAVDIGQRTLSDSELKVFDHGLEYAADLHAVRAVRDRRARQNVALAAYNVFLYLHVIDLMSETHATVPRFSVSSTHPTPLDRLRALREGLHDKDQPDRGDLGMGVRAARDASQAMAERIRLSPRDDFLTFYGSIYLGGLGGRPRRDRIDF